jgi:hypothetical protein
MRVITKESKHILLSEIDPGDLFETVFGGKITCFMRLRETGNVVSKNHGFMGMLPVADVEHGGLWMLNQSDSVDPVEGELTVTKNRKITK